MFGLCGVPELVLREGCVSLDMGLWFLISKSDVTPNLDMLVVILVCLVERWRWPKIMLLLWYFTQYVWIVCCLADKLSFLMWRKMWIVYIILCRMHFLLLCCLIHTCFLIFLALSAYVTRVYSSSCEQLYFLQVTFFIFSRFYWEDDENWCANAVPYLGFNERHFHTRFLTLSLFHVFLSLSVCLPKF